MFFVRDPFGNRVVLYEKTWQIHTSKKHNPVFNEELPDLGDVREAVLNPDQMRRSMEPTIGWQTCIFEKFVGNDNQLLRAPVYYDLEPGQSYEVGERSGWITTSFFPDPPYLSRNVGEIFWTKSDSEEKGNK
jgi:hypothetical protein